MKKAFKALAGIAMAVAVFASAVSAPSLSAKAGSEDIFKTMEYIANQIVYTSIGDGDDVTANITKVLKFEGTAALTGPVIDNLSSVDNMTLVYTFILEDKAYRYTMTPAAAKLAYKPEIKWYGPDYLACFFPFEILSLDLNGRPVEPTTAPVKVTPAAPAQTATAAAPAAPAASVAGAVYTVFPGDTLNAIAARNGVTLAYILDKNPQIKNPNLIVPGQQIKL